SPRQGAQGAKLQVTVLGSGFAANCQVQLQPSVGIQISAASMPAPNEMQVILRIEASAAVGERELWVVCPASSPAVPGGRTAVGLYPFEVIAGAPSPAPQPLSIKSFSPRQAAQGSAAGLTVVGTGFASGCEVRLQPAADIQI